MIAGVVAVGAYLLLKKGGSFAAPFRQALGFNQTPRVTVPYDKVTEILNPALPGQIGYAWRNFSDGVSIGPDGSYYLNGSKVWSPV